MDDLIGGIVTILRKELRAYFTSPIAYVVAAVFWVLSGFFFSNIVAQAIRISQQVDLFSQGGQAFDAPLIASQQFMSVVGTLLLFILPVLTMGLYAEERRRGTMELLATSPITNLAVALGKLKAVLIFFVTLLLPVLTYHLLTLTATNPVVGIPQVLFGYLGLILLAASVLSLGMFISSLTDNTLIAAIGTFGLMLLLWVIDAAAGQESGILPDTLRHLSLLQQYGTWVQGATGLSSLVLFISMIVLGVFLTVQSVEALRWQQN